MNYRELLYDAEIEYLQGDGYAYLSLMPIKELSPDVANWSIDWMKRVSGIHVFGGMNTDSMQLVSNYNTFRFDWCKSNSSESVSINVNTRYSLVQEDGYLKINNVSKECTKNITQTTKFFLFTKNPRESNTQFKGNIYGMKVWSRSTGHILYDFIPVRKGNVGYLFDKVSLKLYGNVGSGAFILGSDVAPAAYVNEVAFLESWGNQYIDTGIKPSTDTKIELKCLYCKSGAGLTNYGALIGADDRDNAYILNHSAIANFTYGLEFSNNFANPQTRLLTFDSTASPQNMRVYDEGGSLVTTLTCLRGVFEVNQNLYLFAVNRGGTPVYGSNRIMYCKIYDGDTLVRDYVPVEYNGIGYMYDKVSGLFFDNKGTGKFLFGSIAKACARSYTRRQLMARAPQELEYLEFPNGNVYFDSTYVPNGKDNVIQCKFKFDGYRNESGTIYYSWIFARPSGGDSYPNYRIMSSATLGYITIQNGRRGNQAAQNRVSVSKGSIYEFYIYKNQYFTVNGTQHTYTDNNPSGTNNNTLKIPDNGMQLKGRFYYLKWWKGDTLVLDWVPMKQGNEIFIYDKINKVRLTRYGSGTLIAGPIK